MPRHEGYLVELVEQDGTVRVLARANDWDWQLVAETQAESLTPPASTPQMLRLVAGVSSWRYERDLYVPSQWVNLIRLPPEYAYGGYQARVPVRRRYGRIVPVHVGPGIQLIYDPDDRRPEFAIRYFNPNPTRRHFRISVDVFPIAFSDQGIPLFELWGELDPFSHSRWWREAPVYDVLRQALDDYRDPNLSKEIISVSSPPELDENLALFVLPDIEFRRRLKDLGYSVVHVASGKHQEKIVRDQDGTIICDYPHRREFYSKEIAMIQRSIQSRTGRRVSVRR